MIIIIVITIFPIVNRSFISSVRSSCTDDGPLYIRQQLFQILSIQAFINAIDVIRCWGYLGTIFGTVLGLSWDYLVTILGLPWDYLGTVLGLSWDYLGTVLGLSWDYLWDYLGTFLGLSWDYLGTILGLS